MYKRSKEPLILTSDQGQYFKNRLAWSRPIAILSYLMLIVMMLYTEWKLPVDWALVNLKLMPLLIFIPGLIKQTFRTYSWICFVCLIYFVVIFPVAYTRSLWSDWLVTLLVTILFISSMMTSRWLQYWRYFLLQQQSGLLQRN
jgi:uncharacterized membrane protein